MNTVRVTVCCTKCQCPMEVSVPLQCVQTLAAIPTLLTITPSQIAMEVQEHGWVVDFHGNAVCEVCQKKLRWSP